MPSPQLTATDCHVWTRERGNGKTGRRQLKVSGRGKAKGHGWNEGRREEGAEGHLHRSTSIQSHWIVHLRGVETNKGFAGEQRWSLPTQNERLCDFERALPSHFKPISFIAKWHYEVIRQILNINQRRRVHLQSVPRQKVDLYLHLIHSTHYKGLCQPRLVCCFCEQGAELSAKAMFVSAGKCLLLLLPVLGGVATVEGWVCFFNSMT